MKHSTPSSSNHRLLQEQLTATNRTPNQWISCGLVGADLTHWQCTLLGQGPYESGLFFVDIQFPSNYPSVPPQIKCTTKTYHPNICLNDGSIDITDILKAGQDPAHETWSSTITVGRILELLVVLWLEPNVKNHPAIYNAEFAKLYVNDRSKFNEYATSWTKQYAQ